MSSSSQPSVTSTLRPSALPTFKPTASPTTSFTGISLDYTIALKDVIVGDVVASNTQHIQSVLDASLLSDNAHNALIAAVANVLGLTMDAVSVLAAEVLSTTNSLSTVSVMVRILAKNSDFATQSFKSSDDLFSFVKTALTTTCTTGVFDTALQTAAVYYQAVELVSVVYDPTVTVDEPTYTKVDTYDPMDAGLSTGEYAGIVIGVLIVAMLVSAVVYFVVGASSGAGEQSYAAPGSSSQV
eukprot:gene35022-43185_t